MTTTHAPISQAELTARWVLFFETLGASTQAGPGWIHLNEGGILVHVSSDTVETRSAADEFRRHLSNPSDPQAIVCHLPTDRGEALLYCHDTTDGGGGEMWWGFDEPACWRVHDGALTLIAENARADRSLCGPDWEDVPGIDLLPDLSGIDEHVAMAARIARDAGLYAFPSQR